jgi:hypothetical protein
MAALVADRPRRIREVNRERPDFYAIWLRRSPTFDRGGGVPGKPEAVVVRLVAQGDLLIEKIPDVAISGNLVRADADGSTVLAHGEASGHRHVVSGKAVLFRDDALARDIPEPLYIGHLHVEQGSATIVHDEHADIALTEGTYRVRRQRQFDPQDAAAVED